MSKARIIAVANHKGGVGKTTTVATVGSIMAKVGIRVLMVDLDSQCNLTDTFVSEVHGNTIFSMMTDRRGYEPMHISENLDLIPGDIDMAALDLKISNEIEREKILKDVFKSLDVNSKYDIVLLDCPPSIALVIVNALTAADDIYVPIVPEYYPTAGLLKLESICDMVKSRLNKNIAIRGIILTKVKTVVNMHSELSDRLREKYGDCVFETVIRENSKLAECPINKMSIIKLAPKSNGAIDYTALVIEILNRPEFAHLIDKKEDKEGDKEETEKEQN